MPKFRVVGKVSASKYLGEFEAETEEEAIELALNSDEACICLCHQCSPEAENPEIHDAEAEEI